MKNGSGHTTSLMKGLIQTCRNKKYLCDQSASDLSCLGVHRVISTYRDCSLASRRNGPLTQECKAEAGRRFFLP